MVVNAAGTYRDTIRTALGCDSLLTTVVVGVRTTTRTNMAASICAGQSYTLPSGIIVNATGVYNDTVRYAFAICDSLITTVTVTQKTTQSVVINPSICAGQSYTLPNGTAVQTAGIYYDTLHYATGGCDSIRRTINLQ
jgi:glycerol-3-phosphate dehydrogenase